MPQSSPLDHRSPPRLTQRLDRIFGEINAVLVAIAIGLAALDLTCFVTLRTVAAVNTAAAKAQTAEPAAAALTRNAPRLPW